MKHRFSILAATVILALGAALGLAGPASAAGDSTCATHQLAVTGWSIQQDHVDTSWDLKCGGGNNEDWIVQLYLEWKDNSGAWHIYWCSNGDLCQTVRPTSGTYNGGTEHSGTNGWNPSSNIACDDIRFHARVDFQFSSPPVTFNSITYHIGCS